jgi:hypothetical protein
MTEFEDKVIKLLETIDSKLDKLLGPGSAGVTSVDAGKVIPTASEAPAPSIKPSAVVEKQEAAAKAIEKPPIEGRRTCPNCSGTSIKEQEDRTQVLHQMGGMKIYAKKLICRNCGYELN